MMKLILHKTPVFLLITFFILSSSFGQSSNENIEDNITYESSIDDNYVYVSLTTVNEPTMLSMLHRGFNVYFDVKGKKKKKLSVQYPSEVIAPQGRPDRNGGGNQSNREERKEKSQDEERKGPDISVLLEEMPRKAKYTTPDSEEEFHLDLNSLDISISYTYDAENMLLHYELKMPKRNIAENKTDFSKLSIGIVTPKSETENDKPSVSFNGGGQSGGRGGQGGPPGGGGGGGPGGGGRGGSQGGSSQNQEQQQRPQEVSINFWFKANPIK